MKLLVDGDLFAYRCSASAENDGADIAISRMESLLDTCLLETGADSYTIYLTGPTNFRYQVYFEYKANRLDAPKPRYLKEARDYLIQNHQAIVSDNCEADDLMGINQTDDTIICSLDKDMLQVPGWHFSWQIEGGSAEKRWVKEAKKHLVSPLEGARSFYTQMLVGDPSDNIKGVQGIGKVGAHKMLGDLTRERDMFDVVRAAYGFDEVMLMNGRVLHIQRKAGELWEFPFETEAME